MAKHLHVYALYCGQGMTNWIEFYATDADLAADRPRPAMTAIVDLGGNVEAASDSIAERLKLFDPAFRRIELVVISHKDTDHWSLIPAFVNKIAGIGVTVKQIWRGGTGWESRGKNAVASLATATKCTSNTLFEDCRDDFGNPLYQLPTELCSSHGCRIRVLCTNVECKRFKANGTSAVIEIELGDWCIILPGDATYETMVWLVGVYQSSGKKFKPCYGMSIPHHGALATAADGYSVDRELNRTTLGTLHDFVKATGPKQAVASAGENNSHRHPLLQVVKQFEVTVDVPADDHFMQMWDYTHGKGSAAIDPPPERSISSWTTSSYEKISPPPGPPPPDPDDDGDTPMSDGDVKKRSFVNPAYKHKAQDVLFKINSLGETQVVTRSVYPRAQRSTATETAPAPSDAEIAAHSARRARAAD